METFFTIYEHAFSVFGAIVKMFYLHKPKIYAELKVDRKDFFIAPHYQPSWSFIVVEVTNRDSMSVQIEIDSFKKESGEVWFPIDFQDDSGFPHPLEDIVDQYYTDKGDSESCNPLKKEMKEYPVLINSGESKKFYLMVEKEYIGSFSNPRLMKKILIRVGLFSLCYRPKITLYNKFIFRMRFFEGLKTKIINSVSAK